MDVPVKNHLELQTVWLPHPLPLTHRSAACLVLDRETPPLWVDCPPGRVIHLLTWNAALGLGGLLIPSYKPRTQDRFSCRGFVTSNFSREDSVWVVTKLNGDILLLEVRCLKIISRLRIVLAE